MKVRLRRRLRGDKEFYYLDFYDKGKRRRETLNLFIHVPISGRLTPEQRAHNKENEKMAEKVFAERLLKIQREEFGLGDIDRKKSSFIKYYEKEMWRRYESKGNFGNWESAFKHIKAYTKDKDVTFEDVNKAWVEGFREYLLTKARKANQEKLSQNSCYSYFNKVRACLRQAIKDDIIKTTPFDQVDVIKQGETHREYLTLDEIKMLVKTDCDYEVLKQAFIFGCLTGLRWSDIQKLTWDEVTYSEENGYMLRFKQQKTGKIETLNISEDALQFLPEQTERFNKVFVGLRYSAWHNQKLREWVMRAGIKKTVTFHVSRHTYATLLLTNGVDIYTVSKMLGHKHLSTTEIYAKIVDEKKKKAAESIKLRL